MADVEVVAVAPEPTGSKRKFGLRSFCAGLCLVLAAILMPVGIIGFWGKNVVTNPDTFSAVVNSTVTDPVVQDEVATWATDQIVGYVQESDVLDNAPQIKTLITKLGFSLKPFIYPFVLNLVQSEAGHQVLSKIITTAQTAVLSILEGNPPPATAVVNGQVVVDFNSLTDSIKQALADRGVQLPSKLTDTNSTAIPKDLADKLPDNVRDRINGATDGAVDKANDALNDASDRVEAGKDNAQARATDIQNQLNADPIVLMNESQLNQARAIYALSVPIATWLIVLALALFVAAIALSTRRRRMVLVTGIVWILAALVVFLTIFIGHNQLTNAFDGSLFEKGSEVFYQLLIDCLQFGAWVTAILGAIMVLVTLGLNYRDRRAKKEVVTTEVVVESEIEAVTESVPTSPIAQSTTQVVTDDRPTTA